MDGSDFQITNTDIDGGVRKTATPAALWLSEYHSQRRNNQATKRLRRCNRLSHDRHRSILSKGKQHLNAINNSINNGGTTETSTTASFGYRSVTLSGGKIRPQGATEDTFVSHTITGNHTFDGRAIFNTPPTGNGFNIRGNGYTDDGILLGAYHNGGGANATKDAINYNGRTNSNTNIQNKASVQELISAAGVATPVGAIMMWMNESAPPGWFKMIGISFDINTYPLLHAYLSNTYGYLAGVIPNWRNYYPVACGTDTSTDNSNLGKKFNYKTAKPHSKFKTAISIPNGEVRTFNGAGSTNAYSDGLATID